VVQRGDKPWTKNQKAEAVAPGIWRTNGGRAHSDLGSQILIEAPRGLILIDPNAGESFEQNWARMVGSGFDPMQIKYVLVTHEHGDHAPGARLWRVVTGAQVVAGATTAYDLQHLTPAGTGYGFHPPTPVDIPISADKELDLAGLKVKAICLPGHTYGSMGYVFQKNARTYVSTGDLIMGGGVLGYDGSLDFSAEDVLRSLRKVASFRPDIVLGGHGIGPADEFIAKGIEAGEETGWSRMTPPAPNPFCRFTQKNYLIAAWREPIVAAAYGDIDGDGRPDVAVLVPKGKGSVVKIYVNRGGKFADVADAEVELPGLERGYKLRILHVGKGSKADLLAASEDHAVLLLAQSERLRYKAMPLEVTRASEAVADDSQGDVRPAVLIGARFVDTFYTARQQQSDGVFHVRQTSRSIPRYLGCQFADVDGDHRDDLITSNGDIFLHRPDGSFSEAAAFHLTPPPSESKDWTWVAAADFEHNGWTDIALLANGATGATVWLYRNTRNPRAPFAAEPSAKFVVAGAEVNRDGPTIADWNGDGIPDLILCKRGNEGGAIILTGSSIDGLNPKRVVAIKLDYVPYYDARFGVADFAGDGSVGLAGFGRAPTGAMGVYIWIRPPNAKAR
jgi:glyoxylase-like metal-dependent hydrolase (beta-lactamase superfamily II)